MRKMSDWSWAPFNETEDEDSLALVPETDNNDWSWAPFQETEVEQDDHYIGTEDRKSPVCPVAESNVAFTENFDPYFAFVGEQQGPLQEPSPPQAQAQQVDAFGLTTFGQFEPNQTFDPFASVPSERQSVDTSNLTAFGTEDPFDPFGMAPLQSAAIPQQFSHETDPPSTSSIARSRRSSYARDTSFVESDDPFGPFVSAPRFGPSMSSPARDRSPIGSTDPFGMSSAESFGSTFEPIASSLFEPPSKARQKTERVRPRPRRVTSGTPTLQSIAEMPRLQAPEPEEPLEVWDDRHVRYEWPDSVTDILKSKQEKGKPGLPKEEIDRLQEYGFYVTDNLGRGVGGQVYKAYTHKERDFDIPLKPGTFSEGLEVNTWRKCLTKKHNLGGQACAIKKVNDAFRKELDIMAQLNHPNCVLLYDYIEVGGGSNRVLYFIMEFINGETTFNKFINQFQRSAPEAQDMDDWTARLIIKHATLGLEYLHSLGILHKDFHGGNFMPHNEAGKMIWKIVDFGLSITKDDKNLDFIEDIRAFNLMINQVLNTKGMSSDTLDRIGSVIDKVQIAISKSFREEKMSPNDLDSMQKICQALEPYFPPRGDGPEDKPPEDSVAFKFCNKFDD